MFRRLYDWVFPPVDVDAEISAISGVANGLATLDSSGKIPLTELPASIQAGLVPVGYWDCSIGSYPSNPSSGQFWICSVAGTISGTSYILNDWLAYNGSTWTKITIGIDSSLYYTKDDTPLVNSQLDFPSEYTEMTYVDGYISEINAWTDAGKTQKTYKDVFTRNTYNQVTEIDKTIYDFVTGTTTVSTIKTTYTRVNNEIVHVSQVRTDI